MWALIIKPLAGRSKFFASMTCLRFDFDGPPADWSIVKIREFHDRTRLTLETWVSGEEKLGAKPQNERLEKRQEPEFVLASDAPG